MGYFLLALSITGQAQVSGFSVQVVEEGSGLPVAFATVKVKASGKSVLADSLGNFSLNNLVELGKDRAVLLVSAVGYETREWNWKKGEQQIQLVSTSKEMDAVVVSGTMRAVVRSASPVPVEVYSAQFFRKIQLRVYLMHCNW